MMDRRDWTDRWLNDNIQPDMAIRRLGEHHA
jgi:hypothetical protein